MRKRKEMGEVAVMEMARLGVKTRARTLAMEVASKNTVKRRKTGSGELQFASSYVQIRSRRRIVITPDNLISQENSGAMLSSNVCSGPNSDVVSVSHCSSNGSSSLVNQRLMTLVVDLEGEDFEDANSTYFANRKRRETTPSSDLCAESDNLESTDRPLEAISHRRSTKEKMPSEEEIDEFFSAAEENEKKRFAEKYNYDIVNDVPLEGCYEWIRLKP